MIGRLVSFLAALAFLMGSAFGDAPDPWKTAARLKVAAVVDGQPGNSCGSGTVIYSAEDRAIVLTCAHLFEEDAPAAAVAIDLFDPDIETPAPGKPGPGKLHYRESHAGRAIAVDHARDVALVEFNPGRRLNASPVAPEANPLTVGQELIAIGCSQARDGTAWSTKVTRLGIVRDRGTYTECSFAPIEGRSGGGLYTTDGRVVGVCCMARTDAPLGLYASPASIRSILAQAGLPIAYTGWRLGVAVGGGRTSPCPPGAPCPQSPATRPKPLPRTEQPFVAPAPPAIPPVPLPTLGSPSFADQLYALDDKLPQGSGVCAIGLAALVLFWPRRQQAVRLAA